MSYSIVVSPHFSKKFKRLSKKFPSLKRDLQKLILALQENPLMGDDLGDNIRKVRMAISSKGKGKRGGARVITFYIDEQKIIHLISIYNKGEKDSISNQEIRNLLRKLL